MRCLRIFQAYEERASELWSKPARQVQFLAYAVTSKDRHKSVDLRKERQVLMAVAEETPSC